jgi:hypothetical protein
VISEGLSRPGGEVLPLSSPSRPGSTTQSKFINLLKNEGMHEEVILDTS